MHRTPRAERGRGRSATGLRRRTDRPRCSDPSSGGFWGGKPGFVRPPGWILPQPGRKARPGRGRCVQRSQRGAPGGPHLMEPEHGVDRAVLSLQGCSGHRQGRLRVLQPFHSPAPAGAFPSCCGCHTGWEQEELSSGSLHWHWLGQGAAGTQGRCGGSTALPWRDPPAEHSLSPFCNGTTA